MKLFVPFCLLAVVVANPEENRNVDDPLLKEGDIRITRKQLYGRAATAHTLWPGGVLVYEISPYLAKIPTAVKAIKDAMNEWARTTCIKFKERTTEEDFVFIKWGNRCSSYVGKIGGKQDLTLDFGCHMKGTVLHEIGHALGFWHEQSRPDRDDYVTILYDNIEKKDKNEFIKLTNHTVNSLGFKYDYDSIMHYDEKAFSKNGQPTIVAKKPGVKLGQRWGLSLIDIKQMGLLYRCKGSLFDYGCNWNTSKINFRCWRYCDPNSPKSSSWCWVNNYCGTGPLQVQKALAHSRSCSWIAPEAVKNDKTQLIDTLYIYKHSKLKIK